MNVQDNFGNRIVNQNNTASLSLLNDNNANHLLNNNFQFYNFNQISQNINSNLNINNLVSLNRNENINKNNTQIPYPNNLNKNTNIKKKNDFSSFDNINSQKDEFNNQIHQEIINFNNPNNIYNNQNNILNNLNNYYNNTNNNLIKNFFIGGNNVINKATKPYFTAKHSLLNAYSLNNINDSIQKDLLQLEKFLPNYQEYIVNNNLESINICLKYIEYTNFFFSQGVTKKVNDLLQKIIYSNDYENNYGNIKTEIVGEIRKKIKELYKKLIPYDMRVNYLTDFYENNSGKSLYNLFKNDLNKYQKYNDKIYYLYEIFEIVKHKMELKDKEEIKNFFNRLLFNPKSQNSNNYNNNSSILGNNGNNNNGRNFQNNYNHHNTNPHPHQNRKYSYQSPGDQNKADISNYNSFENNNNCNYNNNLNGNNSRHNYYNNNYKNNNLLNEDDRYNDNLGFKNNYNNNHHHNSSYQQINNNYKGSYSSKHYYNNNKQNNNRNKGNRKNSFYSGVLVEIDSSPKKSENNNSDIILNKEEDKKIIFKENNEEEKINGNENNINIINNIRNEELNNNDNSEQIDIENNLNINKESIKNENIYISEDEDKKSKNNDNLELKDENMLNDFNSINPFQKDMAQDKENEGKEESNEINIFQNYDCNKNMNKINLKDNLENNEKINDKEKNILNFKTQEQDLILNNIDSNQNNIINSTLYQNNIDDNSNNIKKDNEYQYNINEDQDKKEIEVKDDNKINIENNIKKEKNLRENSPKTNLLFNNNTHNTNTSNNINLIDNNSNNFSGNNNDLKNSSLNNNNNFYNNNNLFSNNLTYEQLFLFMILQNNNMQMNFNSFLNQILQKNNYNNFNNPQLITNFNNKNTNNANNINNTNLLNNINPNINFLSNNLNFQNFNQIFDNYWRDNLLSNLKKNFSNIHSSNYHSNINYINNKCDKLSREYLQLKENENKNPQKTKYFLNLFEERIILPVYIKINEENQIKKEIYTEIYNKYKNIILKILSKHGLEETKIEPYGSIVNNFMTEWGDIDICIVPSDNSLIQSFGEYLEEIKKEAVDIQNCATFNLIERYPRFLILKLNDIEKNIDLDITVQNILPILNTKLIRLYSLQDQRFHIFGIFLKFWVKKNHIHGALDKFLTSYALLILIIHYLQNIADPKILPILQQVQNINKEYKYYYEGQELITNTYFEEDLEKISNYMNIINDKMENNSLVSELLVGFFEFYSYKYDHYLISISHSEKKPFTENDLIAFPIQDPFDINYNPGKSMKINSTQYSAFIYCMKKELNKILSGEYFKFVSEE